MRKAKYKPWHVPLNQKWIPTNMATKWDTSEGNFFSHIKKKKQESLINMLFKCLYQEQYCLATIVI